MNSTAPASFTFANNLWYARDDVSFAGPTYTDGIVETGAVIQMDPGVSESTWELCHDAPGASAGQPIVGICVDHGGRAYLDPPSIGAYRAGSCTD